MALSVHDNIVVSYEVHCEKRTIAIHTEFRDKPPTEFTDIVFEKVEAYHFQNDAFGNIIFDVSKISSEEFIKDYGSEILELNRMSGAPSWARDIGTAITCMQDLGVKAFILTSSLGLSGWVLAKEMFIVPAVTRAHVSSLP